MPSGHRVVLGDATRTGRRQRKLEGLRARRDEPPALAAAALCHGNVLRGTWIDRTAEYRARSAGKDVKPGEFATVYEIKLTPLPCLAHLSEDQRQAHYRRVVKEIDAAAFAANKELGLEPLGVDTILAQDPHHRPVAPARSPAPLVHAHDREKRDDYMTAYREFVANFRAGAGHLLAQAKHVCSLFPDWAFPPPLPFKMVATT